MQTVPPCSDADEVDHAEYCRVALLCAQLAHIDARRVTGIFSLLVPEVWGAESSEFGRLMAKSVDQLDEADCLLAAHQLSFYLEGWHIGMSAYCEHIGDRIGSDVGVADITMMVIWSTPPKGAPNPWLGSSELARTPRYVARSRRLIEIGLPLLMAPSGTHHPRVMQGLCLLVAWCSVGRPEHSKYLIDAGYLGWAARTLQGMPTSDILQPLSLPHALPMGIFWALKDATTESRVLGVELELLVLGKKLLS
eukprot:SAG31_NODE_7484_length_1677_cov_1.252852_1_plen_250_part_10